MSEVKGKVTVNTVGIKLHQASFSTPVLFRLPDCHQRVREVPRTRLCYPQHLSRRCFPPRRCDSGAAEWTILNRTGPKC